MIDLNAVRAKLLESDAEGADRAGVYDSVLEEVKNYVDESEQAAAAATEEIKSLNDKVADLTGKLSAVTETNLKLLDKVKYGFDGADRDDDVNTEITIEDLFKEGE